MKIRHTRPQLPITPYFNPRDRKHKHSPTRSDYPTFVDANAWNRNQMSKNRKAPLPEPTKGQRTHPEPAQTIAGCGQQPPRPSVRIVGLGSSVVSLAGVPVWPKLVIVSFHVYSYHILYCLPPTLIWKNVTCTTFQGIKCNPGLVPVWSSIISWTRTGQPELQEKESHRNQNTLLAIGPHCSNGPNCCQWPFKIIVPLTSLSFNSVCN